jgi:hypothetical protein
MAASVGAESERWCIVLVVVERDGSWSSSSNLPAQRCLVLSAAS